MKYHINNDGDVKRCIAIKKKCKYTHHSSNAQQLRAQAEQMLEQQGLTAFSPLHNEIKTFQELHKEIQTFNETTHINMPSISTLDNGKYTEQSYHEEFPEVLKHLEGNVKRIGNTITFETFNENLSLTCDTTTGDMFIYRRKPYQSVGVPFYAGKVSLNIENNEITPDSIRKIIQGLENHYSVKPTLTKEEERKLTISSVYAGAGHGAINQQLRQGNTSVSEHFPGVGETTLTMEELDDCLLNTVLTEPMTVYRGMPKRVSHHEPDKAYLSTSVKPGVAKGFTHGDDYKVVKFTVPAGTKCMFRLGFEGEVLLPRNYQIQGPIEVFQKTV